MGWAAFRHTHLSPAPVHRVPGHTLKNIGCKGGLSMEGLLQELLRIPEIAELKKNIDTGECRALVTGPGPVDRSF